MSATAKRSRRANAGNKLRTMVEEEQAKLDSGEIAGSDEDEDFVKKGDEEDVVDSDFEETDSEVEHAAADASKLAEALIAKAERRQKRKLAKKRIVPRFASLKTKAKKEPSDSDSTRKSKAPEFAVRFSSRSSAVRKAKESDMLKHEREVMADIKRRHKKPKKAEEAALTQEELLEEAKQTEKLNMEKLKEFQEMAAEEKMRQRAASARKAPLIIQPVVHWKSAAVSSGEPLVREVKTEYSLDEIDDKHYPVNPWSRRMLIKDPPLCPVTGLPARYFHPRVRVPYANARAYRVLEELARGEHAYFYDLGVWGSSASL
ncbi:YL1-domain-containing protein [Linderina pennispora]|uniref:YL1-domain-containing protein n=1 Tax=Linderina pennispora TaxID=61395 RepID=A0A1Y1W011_9FUNG|nr:YL1-domain-containing protein [Linderina pennispora]ORX66860.1 YL1-domain-containing protein [Linderina pennispora]